MCLTQVLNDLALELNFWVGKGHFVNKFGFSWIVLIFTICANCYRIAFTKLKHQYKAVGSILFSASVSAVLYFQYWVNIVS